MLYSIFDFIFISNNVILNANFICKQFEGFKMSRNAKKVTHINI